jgi:hypothetical protein
MRTYEIEQPVTAVILWRGEASSEMDALDLMAREAGYRDYQDLEGNVGSDDGVQVRTVSP